MKKGKQGPKRRRLAKTASSPKPKAPDLPVKLRIPPILLEDDEPEVKSPTTSHPETLVISKDSSTADALKTAQLPEAYSTGQLLLVSRDPHSLYACWDLTSRQRLAYSELSSERKLALRVLQGSQDGPVVAELHFEAEARHSFIHVPNAGSRYVAQLGYYDAQRRWVPISTSQPVMTPYDAPSSDKSLRFSEMRSAPSPRGLKQKVNPTTRATLTPPRVGWLPSLGIVPGIAVGQTAESYYWFEPLEVLSQTGSMVSLEKEWTIEQESELEAILREGLVPEDLSSFSLATGGVSLET